MPSSICSGKKTHPAIDAREPHAQEEAAVEERISLNEQRLGRVMAALKARAQSGSWTWAAARAAAAGCFSKTGSSTEIVGMDVSLRSLEIAKERLHLDRLPECSATASSCSMVR